MTRIEGWAALAVALVTVFGSVSCAKISAARWTYHCAAPVAAGGACLGADECADGLRCVSGRCAAVAREGERCEQIHDCADGLACHFTYTTGGTCLATTCSEAGRDTGNCTTTRSTGRPCAADLTCPPLEVCGLESTATGECRRVPRAGESCDGFLDFACADGLVCQLTPKVCVTPRLGGECGITGEATDQACGQSLGCDARTDGTSVCIGRVPVGGACTMESCVAGAHCSVSTRRCERDLEEGDSCVNGNECGVALGRRLDCVARECVATDEPGAVCWPGRYGCGAGLRCLKDR
jgi:hypothetical protein